MPALRFSETRKLQIYQCAITNIKKYCVYAKQTTICQDTHWYICKWLVSENLRAGRFSKIFQIIWLKHTTSMYQIGHSIRYHNYILSKFLICVRYQFNF